MAHSDRASTVTTEYDGDDRDSVARSTYSGASGARWHRREAPPPPQEFPSSLQVPSLPIGDAQDGQRHPASNTGRSNVSNGSTAGGGGTSEGKSGAPALRRAPLTARSTAADSYASFSSEDDDTEDAQLQNYLQRPLEGEAGNSCLVCGAAEHEGVWHGLPDPGPPKRVRRKVPRRGAKPSAAALRALVDAEPDAVVGHFAAAAGEMEFDSLLRVDGNFAGNLLSTNHRGVLVVGHNAVIDGSVIGPRQVVCLGRIKGNIETAQLLLTGTNARVDGTIKARHAFYDERPALTDALRLLRNNMRVRPRPRASPRKRLWTPSTESIMTEATDRDGDFEEDDGVTDALPAVMMSIAESPGRAEAPGHIAYAACVARRGTDKFEVYEWEDRKQRPWRLYHLLNEVRPNRLLLDTSSISRWTRYHLKLKLHCPVRRRDKSYVEFPDMKTVLSTVTDKCWLGAAKISPRAAEESAKHGSRRSRRGSALSKTSPMFVIALRGNGAGLPCIGALMDLCVSLGMADEMLPDSVPVVMGSPTEGAEPPLRPESAPRPELVPKPARKSEWSQVGDSTFGQGTGSTLSASLRQGMLRRVRVRPAGRSRRASMESAAAAAAATAEASAAHSTAHRRIPEDASVEAAPEGFSIEERTLDFDGEMAAGRSLRRDRSRSPTRDAAGTMSQASSRSSSLRMGGDWRGPSPVDTRAPRFGRRASDGADGGATSGPGSRSAELPTLSGARVYRSFRRTHSVASMDYSDPEVVRRDLRVLKQREQIDQSGSDIGCIEYVAAQYLPAKKKVQRELTILKEKLYDDRAPRRGHWAKAFSWQDVGVPAKEASPELHHSRDDRSM